MTTKTTDLQFGAIKRDFLRFIEDVKKKYGDNFTDFDHVIYDELLRKVNEAKDLGDLIEKIQELQLKVLNRLQQEGLIDFQQEFTDNKEDVLKVINETGDKSDVDMEKESSDVTEEIRKLLLSGLDSSVKTAETNIGIEVPTARSTDDLKKGLTQNLWASVRASQLGDILKDRRPDTRRTYSLGPVRIDEYFPYESFRSRFQSFVQPSNIGAQTNFLHHQLQQQTGTYEAPGTQGTTGPLSYLSGQLQQPQSYQLSPQYPAYLAEQRRKDLDSSSDLGLYRPYTTLGLYPITPSSQTFSPSPDTYSFQTSSPSPPDLGQYRQYASAAGPTLDTSPERWNIPIPYARAPEVTRFPVGGWDQLGTLLGSASSAAATASSSGAVYRPSTEGLLGAFRNLINWLSSKGNVSELNRVRDIAVENFEKALAGKAEQSLLSSGVSEAESAAAGGIRNFINNLVKNLGQAANKVKDEVLGKAVQEAAEGKVLGKAVQEVAKEGAKRGFLKMLGRALGIAGFILLITQTLLSDMRQSYVESPGLLDRDYSVSFLGETIPLGIIERGGKLGDEDIVGTEGLVFGRYRPRTGDIGPFFASGLPYYQTAEWTTDEYRKKLEEIAGRKLNDVIRDKIWVELGLNLAGNEQARNVVLKEISNRFNAFINSHFRDIRYGRGVETRKSTYRSIANDLEGRFGDIVRNLNSINLIINNSTVLKMHFRRFINEMLNEISNNLRLAEQSGSGQQGYVDLLGLKGRLFIDTIFSDPKDISGYDPMLELFSQIINSINDPEELRRAREQLGRAGIIAE